MKYWLPEGRREAFNYCREVTRVHSKSFYVSTMMLPEERRWATFAVYAFCRYADNIVDEPGGRSNEDVWRELEMLREGLSMAYKQVIRSIPYYSLSSRQPNALVFRSITRWS
jgi:phytoene/squalene synthetase